MSRKYFFHNVAVITDSGLYTILEIFQIYDRLSHGDNKLRNEAAREELLSSCLDLKMYQENDRIHYFVGTIGAGMQAKLPRAALIRTVERIGQHEMHFEDILPMMNVSFIRNGQLTVVPFPFKYLREYVNQRT